MTQNPEGEDISQENHFTARHSATLIAVVVAAVVVVDVVAAASAIVVFASRSAFQRKARELGV